MTNTRRKRFKEKIIEREANDPQFKIDMDNARKQLAEEFAMNTPESDTMKTLTELAKENGALIGSKDLPCTNGIIVHESEAQLLATFNAWSAQQEPKHADDIECEQFYNICQAYRHARDNANTVNAYEALKKYIANLFKG